MTNIHNFSVQGSKRNEAADQSDKIQRKRRTLKACDTCRSRKLKCDGQVPCQRCLTSDAECKYTHVEKRRKLNASPSLNKRASKTLAIQTLDERMSKLESLISSLVTKIDPTIVNSGINSSHTDPLSVKSNNPRDEGSPSTQNDYSSPSDDSAILNDETPRLNANEIDEFEDPSLKGSKAHLKRLKESPVSYFGSQTSLSILDPKGLIWLAKKAGDPTIFRRFLNIDRKFNQVFAEAVAKWRDFEKCQIVPLPPRETISPFCASFFGNIWFAKLIITEKELNELFDTYYASQETHAQPGVRTLSNSNMLLLSSIVALGVLFRMEDMSIPTGSQELRHLKEIRENYMLMSIYYYHKVCVFSEGLSTIQGMLVLILNTEFSPTPHLNYTLISTAVRFAQEIGLHRAETAHGSCPEEALRRRQIWCQLHLRDSELCLKSGKPPIINVADVTHFFKNERHLTTLESLTPEAFEFIHSAAFNPASLEDREKLSLLNNNAEEVSLKTIIMDFFCEYLSLSTKAYGLLFNATALRGKSASQIMNIIQSLNEQLEDITERIPTSFRPGEKFNRSMLTSPERYEFMMLQFQYYLQGIIINRMAFKRSWSHDGLDSIDDSSLILPQQNKFMSKCLESARSMLTLFSRLDSFQALFYNYCSFFFYSAFFTLFAAIIEQPSTVESRNDLIFLKQKFEVYFGNLSLYAERHLDKLTYNVLSYFLKFFLKVAISVHNNTIKPGDGLTKIDSTALDNEINLHNKILIHNYNTSPHSIGAVCDLSGNSGNQPVSSERCVSNKDNCFQSEAKECIECPTYALKGTFSYQSSPNQPDEQMKGLHATPSTAPPVSGVSGTPQNNSAVISSNTNPFDFPVSNSAAYPSLQDQFDFDEWDLDKNSSVLQQIFAIPNFYLNNNDLELLELTPTTSSGDTSQSQGNTGVHGAFEF